MESILLPFPFNVLLIPLAILLAQILYSLFKQDNRDDRFFRFHKRLKKDELLEGIRYLEQLNQADYSRPKQKVEKYFADNRLSDKELEYLEEMMINTYFGGFTNRWTSFRKSPFLLIVFFAAAILNGFIAFPYILYLVNSDPMKGVYADIGTCILISILLFPVPLILGFLYIGFSSVFLQIATFVVPGKGAPKRASITLEEMIKSLKPGGRNAPTFPDAMFDSTDVDSWF